MYNPEIEAATRADMESLQLNRLQKTVRNVYENVLFYKKSLMN